MPVMWEDTPSEEGDFAANRSMNLDFDVMHRTTSSNKHIVAQLLGYIHLRIPPTISKTPPPSSSSSSSSSSPS